MEETSYSCCILAHTNSKGFFFFLFLEEIPIGIYIYLTHSYTQTQYQVVEYFSHTFAIYSVMGTMTRHSKHSCASGGITLIDRSNPFSLSIKFGGAGLVAPHRESALAPPAPAHRIVNDK